jgi:hypothetical protein
LLPVTPEKLTTEINGKNKTVTLINEGEVNILKKPGLTDIEFTCLLPSVKYPFGIYKNGFQKASYFLNYFEKLKTSKKPFQFIVTRKFPNGKSIYDTNMKVSLEEYKIEESADEGFDCKVTISLKQWRDYGTKTVKVSAAKKKVSATSSRSSETAPTTSTNQKYTVVKGDCLYAIARKFYGNGAKYTVIYNANKSVIGGDPSLIYAGQVLTIPAS